MKYKRTRKIRILPTFIMLTLTALPFLLMYYYENIHLPAMASTISGCELKLSNTNSVLNTFIEGGKTRLQYNPENDTFTVISVNINNEETNPPELNNIIKKHEACHVEQFQRKIFRGDICFNNYCGKEANILKKVQCYNYSGVLRRYLIEAECYIRQKF